jgi:hypothetical protein
MATITSSGVVQDSITRNGRYEPFNLQAARGQITGHSIVSIFGYGTISSTAGTFTALWENGSNTQYVFPASATTMTLTGSAGDTAQIQINGLDANYNPISEVATLNGTTGVTTANSYLRINSMQTYAGSSTNPSGAVTLANSGTTYAKMAANTSGTGSVGKTQMSIYTVPNGYTFYLMRLNGFTGYTQAGSNYVTHRTVTNSSSGVQIITLNTPFINIYDIHRYYGFAYAAKTDLQFQLAPSASSAATSAGLAIEGILIANDGTL